MMQLCKSQAILGTLAGAILLPLPSLLAQQQIPLTVEDASGAAVAGAAISDAAHRSLGVTDKSGALTISCNAPCVLIVSAPGFAAQTERISAATTIRLEPESSAEQVTVTAYRTPLGDLESPATTRVLSQSTLAASAGVTLDDQVRQLPGVETFRRSPSLVANPTSQGVSLRGLGSTSASRTLVTEDDVPLNDPLGGWIHWQEQPELAIQSVELVRGGASDLYGSSAIGGVINVVPTRPQSNLAELTSTFGGEGTYDSSALAQTAHGPWGVLAAAGMLGTDGYIQESPLQRGPVDDASNVHSQNALVAAERKQGPLRIFLRTNAFDESRHNGTQYQFNATRLFRYATGADWANAKGDTFAVRLYGSDERYRQTFSSISNAPNASHPSCTYRCGETPSRYSYVPDNELGASAHWSHAFGAGLLFLAGADSHDVRVWDQEHAFGSSAAVTNLHDHQRDSGAYAELMAERNQWTAIASAREDWYENFDGHQVTFTGSGWTPSATQPTQQSQQLFDPRLGLSRKIGQHWSLSASGFRAFRAPSPNELYRSTQVGNQLTLPNNNLLSERATGWEAGLAAQHSWGTVRAGYFDTQVNRPIAALTINPNSSPILLMRENLAQIESRGLSLDYELAPLHWLTADGGYQYAHAVVSRGTLDRGNWIPEVAREMATLNLRAAAPRLGTLSLESRVSGPMFDDDANAYRLGGYFRLDAYASHNFGSRWTVFAAAENLTGQFIEVSKTPTTTLGQPRVGRFGFTLSLGAAAR